MASSILNRKNGKGFSLNNDWQSTINNITFWGDSHEQRMSSQRRNPQKRDKIPGTKIELSNVRQKHYQDFYNTNIRDRNNNNYMKDSNGASIYMLKGGVDLTNGATQWRGRGTHNYFFK